jgi:hypothetical protein
MKRIAPVLAGFSASRNELSSCAGLYANFGDIQLPCDIAMIQTMTKHSIDRTKTAGLFPA